MAVAVRERVIKETPKVLAEPKFRDPTTMTIEELTDPDYRLKQLVKLNGGKPGAICSRCHHCR